MGAMASYRRFEDLPAWQSAAILYEQLDIYLRESGSHLSYAFKDQIARTSDQKDRIGLYHAIWEIMNE